MAKKTRRKRTQTIVPGQRTAKVFRKDHLPNVLKKVFFEEDGPRHVVLLNPSLETFNPIPIVQRGTSEFRRIWSNLYLPNIKDTSVTLIIPLDKSNGLPPKWLNVAPVLSLINEINDKPDGDIATTFKALCKNVKIVFSNIATPKQKKQRDIEHLEFLADSYSAYAFGLYFTLCKESDFYDMLDDVLEKEGEAWIEHFTQWPSSAKNIALTQVHLALGTSIGKPFGYVGQTGFKYQILLQFDRGTMPNLKVIKNGKERCIVLEHLGVVFSAVKNMAPPIFDPGDKDYNDWGIFGPERSNFIYLDRFVAWLAINYAKYPDEFMISPLKTFTGICESLAEAYKKMGLDVPEQYKNNGDTKGGRTNVEDI